MATHSSILAWRIPWTEELGGLQSVGLRQSWTQLSNYTTTTTTNLPGKGNYMCLLYVCKYRCACVYINLSLLYTHIYFILNFSTPLS